MNSFSKNSPDTLRFALGQRVWFALNDENEGMITGILFRPNGVIYMVVWQDMDETEHYEFELTADAKEATKRL